MPDNELLTPHPFSDALDKLGTSGEGLELTAVKDPQHTSVSLEGAKNVGKGWSLAGGFAWAKDAGYAALGKISWKPKA